MPCDNNYIFSYTEKKYPNCPVPDGCGICRLLTNSKFAIEEYKVDNKQTIFTFKRIKDEGGNLIYPLTPTEAQMITQKCYRAVLKSCLGEEEVRIVEYDILNGKITLERGFAGSVALNHQAPIVLDFGVFTIDMANKMLDVLCELYTRFCSSYPDCATAEMSGIGKASFIEPSEQGKCPTFITNADPRWQILITKFGLDDETSSTGILSEFLVFLNQPATCDSDIKNKDVLEDIISQLCGKIDCVVKIVDILCNVLEEVKVGNNVKGINFADRFISADYGIKPLLFVNDRDTGTITPTANTTYIAPALSFDGNSLTDNLTGKGVVNGYTGKLEVTIQTISLPVRGRIQISGYLSAGYNQGLMYPKITIKNGSVIEQEYILSPVDLTGQDRGVDYGNLSSPIVNLSLNKLTDVLEVGTYRVQLDFIYILPPNKSTDKSASVYAWDWNIIFLPA